MIDRRPQDHQPPPKRTTLRIGLPAALFGALAGFSAAQNLPAPVPVTLTCTGPTTAVIQRLEVPVRVVNRLDAK